MSAASPIPQTAAAGGAATVAPPALKQPTELTGTTPPTKPSLEQQTAVGTYWGIGLLSLLPSILFSLGAAKLSYDRFRSFGWAIVAFFFSAFYYPYYAYFVSAGPPMTAPTGLIGAARRAMR